MCTVDTAGGWRLWDHPDEVQKEALLTPKAQRPSKASGRSSHAGRLQLIVSGRRVLSSFLNLFFYSNHVHMI